MKHYHSILLAVLFFCFTSVSAHSSCVVLLHGLARSDSSMKTLEKALVKQNYQVINQDYPSSEYSIKQLAEKFVSKAVNQCSKESEVNFVTHSMGGILVREYLNNHKVENLNRVVMLGPPNQGSEVIDKIGTMPGFELFGGDAGLELGTEDGSTPNTLGPANFDVGVIAGTRSVNWVLSMMIPGTDDGKVSVERTKLEGMSDHLEVPVTHVFMIKRKAVIYQVIHYLENGIFERS
ncbi:MAG: alpha/beta hydrolase [Cellvibrionaceae bacterium]